VLYIYIYSITETAVQELVLQAIKHKMRNQKFLELSLTF